MAKKRKMKMEFRYYQMQDGSPILALLGEKWEQNYGRDVDYLHFHNYLEIGFCYSGEGELIFGEEPVRFAGREFTIIPPNFPHTTTSDIGNISKWEYLFIDVEGFLAIAAGNRMRAEKMVQRIYSKALCLKECEYKSLSEKVLGILNVMHDGEEFYLEEAKGILLSLLAEVARLNRSAEEENVEEKGKITNMIARSIDYISQYYMEDIRIGDLAKASHISETHFRRVFTSYMHMSPLEYINKVRIQTACEILKKTDEPISDIAYKCGFTTNSTFNRNFRQLMGMSPAEWRKRPENYEQQLLKFDIHSEKGW